MLSLKRMTASAAVACLAAAAVPSHATSVDVGVSIQVSQPGVYGRIDIGRFPQPQVIVTQPVVVAPVPVVVARPVEPVYLWVPPGHRKNWRRHCADYGACGVPVMFVRHDWYQGHVMPHAEHRHGRDDHRHGKGHGRGRGKGGRDD